METTRFLRAAVGDLPACKHEVFELSQQQQQQGATGLCAC